MLNWYGVDEDDIRTHTHTQMQMQNTHQQRQPDNGSWKRKRNAKMPVDNIALLCLFALNDFRSEAQRVCIISCCVYLSLRVFGFVLMLLTWKLSIGNVGKNKSDAKKTNTYEFETTSYEINGKPQVITKFSIFTQCLHFMWFFVCFFRWRLAFVQFRDVLMCLRNLPVHAISFC